MKPLYPGVRDLAAMGWIFAAAGVAVIAEAAVLRRWERRDGRRLLS